MNPRTVKHFINKFIIANEIYLGIDPTELLVTQALKERWGTFYKYLSSYEDFREEVNKYIGLSETERRKIFTEVKENYSPAYISKVAARNAIS